MSDSTNQVRTIQIFLAIKQPGIRRGLQACLSYQSDFSVVGSADTWEDTLAQVQQLQPDVLLLDSYLIEDDGRPSAQKASAFGQKVKILLLDQDPSPVYVKALLAEVHLKDCLGLTEVDAISAAIRRLSASA
jgi:DNA-binding NarL/FixJ family response regulator